MDIKRSSPLQPGDRPQDRRTPSDPEASENRQAENNPIRERLSEEQLERAQRARRVAREVGKAVQEELLPKPAEGDQLQLSEAGQAASAGATRSAEEQGYDEPTRAAHIAALKAAIEAGSLHTPERLETAARRMLGELA